MVIDIGRPTIAPTSTPDDNSRMRKCYPALKKPRLSARCRRPGNQIVFAELLPKLVLIGYAQSGKCNERQASNYADSSVFIRSDNQVVKSMILGGCRINHHNKTCTGLNFGSEGIANVEFPQRAISSGGRGQRFESSRARHLDPGKTSACHKALWPITSNTAASTRKLEGW